MQKQDFMELSKQQVLTLIRELGRPKLGVFVPDGSRRLVLAYDSADLGSKEFYQAAAQLPAKHLQSAICTFFDFGLPTLLVPILGRSILKRGSDYQKYTLLNGLSILFLDSEWKDLYKRYDICVRTYGHLECLKGTICEPALEWIKTTCADTTNHKTFSLFFGIGESPIVGEESARNAVNFFQKNQRMPSLLEQIQAYYGMGLSPADFFIMTSKMSGMGALPNLLVNGDTEVYYLPTLMGLTETNYRAILYDLLYERAPLRHGVNDFDLQLQNRHALRQAYENSIHRVVGLGFTVGKVWTMQDGDTASEVAKANLVQLD